MIQPKKEPLVSTASSSSTNQKVVVFDFGAQYGQLIARRVRDLNVYSEIVPCDITADEVREMAFVGDGGHRMHPCRHRGHPA